MKIESICGLRFLFYITPSQSADGNKTLKNMKKLLNFSLLAILAASFVLTGCKKDDDSNPGGETTKQDGILPKKVVKIVKNWVDDGESDTYTFDSEGRPLTKNSYSYTYGDNKIIITSKHDGTMIFNLENGRIVSGRRNDDTYTFQYTKEGFLSSVLLEEHSETEGDEISSGQYKYSQGNMIEYI